MLIIGCGNIAGRFDMARPADAWPMTHAGAFTSHGGFELSACVDPNDQIRETFADYWAIPHQAKSIDALDVTSGEFDVISICSPTTMHHEHIESALKLSPKLIFCEKPLTRNAALSSELVRAAEDQGVQLIVNYTRQWDPSIAQLIEEIQNGIWGSVRSVAGFYNKGVLNNGGHLIDLILRLLGPLNVLAATAAVHDHWDNDPTIAGLLISKKNSIPVSLNPSHASDYALFELELICQRGVVRMRSAGLKWEVRKAKVSPNYLGYWELSEPEFSEGGYVQAMKVIANEIYDFLSQGRMPRSTGKNALAVQMICDHLVLAATLSGSPSN